mmetsp:Transcript_15858/g.36757  ORF Transcript_15858/g.36757 Transcript_15858/m.36757 type:complete len:333 (-) Transcript_15858:6-1004(-)
MLQHQQQAGTEQRVPRDEARDGGVEGGEREPLRRDGELAGRDEVRGHVEPPEQHECRPEHAEERQEVQPGRLAQRARDRLHERARAAEQSPRRAHSEQRAHARDREGDVAADGQGVAVVVLGRAARTCTHDRLAAGPQHTAHAGERCQRHCERHAERAHRRTRKDEGEGEREPQRPAHAADRRARRCAHVRDLVCEPAAGRAQRGAQRVERRVGRPEARRAAACAAGSGVERGDTHRGGGDAVAPLRLARVGREAARAKLPHLLGGGGARARVCAQEHPRLEPVRRVGGRRARAHAQAEVPGGIRDEEERPARAVRAARHEGRVRGRRWQTR